MSTPIRCPECGRFASSRDYFDENEEIDFDLARELGITDDEISEACVTASGPASRVLYVEEVAICYGCGNEFHFKGADRWYWDETHACFGSDRPLTPTQQAAAEYEAQEVAGQLRLF
ncbi:MAG: hypothetical protein IH587_02595 [Anaerolineae bacterium]|nr:hypothetical protein [Anaerolineae bacterium]